MNTIYKAFWPTRKRENNLPQCESVKIKTPRIQILAKPQKKDPRVKEGFTVFNLVALHTRTVGGGGWGNNK